MSMSWIAERKPNVDEAVVSIIHVEASGSLEAAKTH
jgi:hypothetical protein